MQSEIIVHEALKEHLKLYGYASERTNQALWTNQDRETNFTLVVDYFGINYSNKKDADHLVAEIQ